MESNGRICLYISHSKFQHWLSCYKNLQIYYPMEKDALIDIVHDEEGHIVKIFLVDDNLEEN